MGMESSHDGIPIRDPMHSTSFSFVTGRHGHKKMTRTLRPTATPLYIYICIYIYTWTVLEPHSFRSLWIFRCRPKNHFWATSDGFNDTVLVSKSWSFASFFASFCVISLVLLNVTDRGQNQQLFDSWSLTTFQSRQKNAAFGCPGIYIYIYHRV